MALSPPALIRRRRDKGSRPGNRPGDQPQLTPWLQTAELKEICLARRNNMYHFTIIDEASIVNEQKSSNMQDKSSRNANVVSKEAPALPSKTSVFLHRYLDKNCGVRIFINKE
jgi:hypothetical protein